MRSRQGRQFLKGRRRRKIIISSMVSGTTLPRKMAINGIVTSFTTNNTMNWIRTITRHMTQALTVETDLIRTFFHSMTCVITFMTGRSFVRMFHTKKKAAKTKEGWNGVIKITFKNTDTIVNIRIVLELETTKRENSSIIPKTALDIIIWKFKRSIIYKNTVRIVSTVVMRNGRRLLEIEVMVPFGCKGDKSRASRISLNTLGRTIRNTCITGISENIGSRHIFIQVNKSKTRLVGQRVVQMKMFFLEKSVCLGSEEGQDRERTNRTKHLIH